MATLLKKRHSNDWRLCGDTIFYKSSELLSTCGRSFETQLNERAVKEAPNVAKLLRQQQSAAAASTATTTTKKPTKLSKKRGGKGGKRGGGDDDDSEHEQSPSQADLVEFMSIRQLIDSLKKNEQLRQDYLFDTCPEELLSELAEELRQTLNIKYRQQLETIFLASNSVEQQQQQHGGDGKKSRAEFEETFRRLYQNIWLFEQDAAALFNGKFSSFIFSRL